MTVETRLDPQMGKDCSPWTERRSGSWHARKHADACPTATSCCATSPTAAWPPCGAPRTASSAAAWRSRCWPSASPTTTTAVRRFKREARTAARLSAHRNVVTIYDVGEPAGPTATRASRRVHRDGVPRRRHRRRRDRAWARSPPARRCDGRARPRRRSTTPTGTGSCTATSSPPTSCSTAIGCCTSPTSGSPGSRPRTRSPAPASCSAPPPTWRPSGARGKATDRRQRPLRAGGGGVRAAHRAAPVLGRALRRPGAPAHRGRARRRCQPAQPLAAARPSTTCSPAGWPSEPEERSDDRRRVRRRARGALSQPATGGARPGGSPRAAAALARPTGRPAPHAVGAATRDGERRAVADAVPPRAVGPAACAPPRAPPARHRGHTGPRPRPASIRPDPPAAGARRRLGALVALPRGRRRRRARSRAGPASGSRPPHTRCRPSAATPTARQARRQAQAGPTPPRAQAQAQAQPRTHHGDRDPAPAPGAATSVRSHAAADGRDARRPRPRADAEAAPTPRRSRCCARRWRRPRRAASPTPTRCMTSAARCGWPATQGGGVRALPAAEDPQPDRDGQAELQRGAAGARPGARPRSITGRDRPLRQRGPRARRLRATGTTTTTATASRDEPLGRARGADV